MIGRSLATKDLISLNFINSCGSMLLGDFTVDWLSMSGVFGIESLVSDSCDRLTISVVFCCVALFFSSLADVLSCCWGLRGSGVCFGEWIIILGPAGAGFWLASPSFLLGPVFSKQSLIG